MTFFLTPRFAPAYTSQQCSPWSCAPTRPSYTYRRIARPATPSFVPFLSQVDELLGALDLEARREVQIEAHREAQREAHRQRQLRKRLFRAHFVAQEHNDAYQIDGEIPGFEQKNLVIEVTDAHTIRVIGSTEEKTRKSPQPEIQSLDVQERETRTAEAVVGGVTLNDTEQEHPSSPAHSETGSTKSYQATVEDDFEDLGAEISSSVSAISESPEPKGKEKAVEPVVESTLHVQSRPEAPAPSQYNSEDDAFQRSFERTFRFGERIDSANVRASLKNGLLSITVPKAKAVEVRRILIQ